MEKLRLLQPLFASVSQDFLTMPDKVKTFFRKMGSRILKSVYADTVFNKELILHGENELEDNFDLVHLTAEKLYIIRPILKPTVLDQLLNGIWIHIDTVFFQCVAAFYPQSSEIENKIPDDMKPVDVDSDDECLPWLKDLREQNKSTKREMEEFDEDTYQPPNDTIPEDEPIVTGDAAQSVGKENESNIPSINVVKRRLRRMESDFDKNTKQIVHRNQSRTEMVNKAMSIFDMVVDYESVGTTISAVISHIWKFEEEWSKSPKDTRLMAAMALEKLVLFLYADCNYKRARLSVTDSTSPPIKKYDPKRKVYARVIYNPNRYRKYHWLSGLPS